MAIAASWKSTTIFPIGNIHIYFHGGCDYKPTSVLVYRSVARLLRVSSAGCENCRRQIAVRIGEALPESSLKLRKIRWNLFTLR